MKILIAEDDQYIREGLQDLLEAEGYQTFVAVNGMEAVNKYHEHSPNLVLLDIMMPEKDGYTVCREIRSHSNIVPVIFLSAKSEEIDRVVGLELGADDYIMKPFGIREVVARIRAVTRRCLATQSIDGGNPRIFKLGDLDVYPEELRARREGEKIDLSPRDVSILELLHEKQGKVVDRDTLFDRCWGQRYLANSRTLDQHISKLRKLIEQDPQQPKIIRTVHGVGYRFDS
jgi:DNA-binding response OmpR family regulator